MQTAFLPPPEFRRLASDRAQCLRYLDYDEEGGTRNYCFDLRAFGCDSPAWYVIRIGLMDDPGRDQVEVVVEAGHECREIGRFTIATSRFPSPLSLDPEATRRAVDLVIAHCS